MKGIQRLSILGLLFVATICPGVSATAGQLSWGKNVGPVSAVVAGTDGPEGLTVRAEPSEKSRVLSHVRIGERIEGQNIFKEGWMKIEKGATPGWISIAFLQPLAFEHLVTRAIGADFCLPIMDIPTDAGNKIDCAKVGRVLKFSGVMTADNWLELAENAGWMRAFSGLRDGKFVSEEPPSRVEEAKMPEASRNSEGSRTEQSASVKPQQSRPRIQTRNKEAPPAQGLEQNTIRTGQGTTERMLEESWHEMDEVMLPRDWANY